MPSPSWQELFKRGVSLFKGEKYEDAIECFSTAIGINNHVHQLYDSRASSFEKLERNKEALKDAKCVIDLAPTLWQGYARSARLFLRINKPEAALKMVDMAIERVKLNDSKRRAELALLRGLIQRAIANSICHFQKLPIELIIGIFTNVIGDSNTVMLRLMTICRFWRELIIGTPVFWARLAISKKSKQKKVDAWLERSKGRLDSLHLVDSFDLEVRPNTFRHAPPSLWSNLRELRLSRNYGKHMSLPDGVAASLKLKVICFAHSTVQHPFELPSVLDLSSVEDFSFSTISLFPPLPYGNFSNLNQLSLAGSCIGVERLFELLPHAENLRQLSIQEAHRPYRRLNVDNLGRLVRLARLSISGLVIEGEWSTLMDLPLLSDVTFAEGVDKTDLKDDHENEIISLKWKSLHFRRFVLSCENLTSTLKKANALSTLAVHDGHLRPSFDQIPSDVAVLELLARQGDLACSKLEHLYWSSSLSTRARDLVRVVKARLPSTDVTGTPFDSQENTLQDRTERPLPLKTLAIDDCPNVDPEALPWLRANVPTFSCKYNKGEKRKRM